MSYAHAVLPFAERWSLSDMKRYLASTKKVDEKTVTKSTFEQVAYAFHQIIIAVQKMLRMTGMVIRRDTVLLVGKSQSFFGRDEVEIPRPYTTLNAW